MKLILDLKNKGHAKRLVLTQNNSKDKETALQFLENLIVAAHQALESKPLNLD